MSFTYVVVVIGLYVEIDIERTLRFAVRMYRFRMRIPAAPFALCPRLAVGNVEANRMSVMVVRQNRSREHQHSGHAREYKR